MAKYVALVPLRGGSKSIPNKNIALIAGKPLCEWVLETACQSGVFSEVVVSTDSNTIAEVVRGTGLPVRILDRPAELATDTASTESVMVHAALSLDFDVLVTIQATSPLVSPQDFSRAVQFFEAGEYDSLLTAVRTKRFFWDNDGNALNYIPSQRPRRQDFPGTLMENGAFYFTRRSVLENENCRLGGRIGVYEMAPESAVEIDEPSDWTVVERELLAHKDNALCDLLQNIKLLVVDVDGTLTDAGMYWSAEGDQLKKFNTRDAKGLELVRQVGVEVALMTSENSRIVTARAKKLNIKRCFIGVKDKLQCLDQIISELGVSFGNVAYIGDDLNDLECMKLAGFSACPADAVNAVQSISTYISENPGGTGAVRDICEKICAARVMLS